MPKREELENGTGYLFYELSMLFHARIIHTAASKKQEQGPSAEHNAMWNAVQCCAIEAFLLHYRNLYEFFWNIDKSPKNDKDSLLAEQYAPGWSGEAEWQKDAPPDEQSRINKLLSHISFRRDDLGPGKWPLLQMEQRVCRVFRQFITQVTDGEAMFSRAMAVYKARTDALTKPLTAVHGIGDASTTSVTQVAWWGFELDLWK